MPHGGTIINFPGQESNEQIFIFVRRYIVAFLPIATMIGVMTILGLVLIIFLGIGDFLSTNQQILLGSFFVLFMLLFTLVEFLDFYFDLNIVTDRRIVDIDQRRLFNRSVSTLLLDDIQDVTADSKGVLPTLFNYGDVHVQTAGSQPNFTFQQVRHPNEIAAIILDLSDQTHRGVEVTDRHPEGPIAAIIDDRILPHTKDHRNEVI